MIISIFRFPSFVVFPNAMFLSRFVFLAFIAHGPWCMPAAVVYRAFYVRVFPIFDAVIIDHHDVHVGVHSSMLWLRSFSIFVIHFFESCIASFGSSKRCSCKLVAFAYQH